MATIALPQLPPQLPPLLHEIHACRMCPCVIPSQVPRAVVATWRTDLVLMAQAPGEQGVPVSGVHWVDAHGKFRARAGTFLDGYLRRIGYSINPEATHLPRPYTTNVLQCWPGRRQSGNRDRAPRSTELSNCSKWWQTELQMLRPRAVVLLGKPAADAFATACNIEDNFATMLEGQGKVFVFAGVAVPVFTVPHPTASYRGPRGGRKAYYELAFSALKVHLECEENTGDPG
jgi:uracil-DNA glycosylase family 4